jgi:hypothetical protein
MSSDKPRAGDAGELYTAAQLAHREWDAMDASMKRRNRALLGDAGEFYAAARLAQRAWNVSVMSRNAPRTDIEARNAKNRRTIAVQCKTSAGEKRFRLNAACEDPGPAGSNEWFVLIYATSPDKRPDFYVMPRNVVAAYIYIGYRVWRKQTEVDGIQRKATTSRVVEISAAAPYHERWDLLESPEEDVPCWLTDRIFAWEPHIGLPPGHPGIVPSDDGVERPAPPNWLPEAPNATRLRSARA